MNISLPDLLAAVLGPPPAAGHVVKSPNHEAGFQAGLIEGIDRTLHVIENIPDLTIEMLADVLNEIRDELAGEADDDDAEDQVLDLLRAVFGPNVQVVRVEQAAR